MKVKKILAGVLCAAMVVSSCISASAEIKVAEGNSSGGKVGSIPYRCLFQVPSKDGRNAWYAEVKYYEHSGGTSPTINCRVTLQGPSIGVYPVQLTGVVDDTSEAKFNKKLAATSNLPALAYNGVAYSSYSMQTDYSDVNYGSFSTLLKY